MTNLDALRAEAAQTRAVAAEARTIAAIPDGVPLREDVRFKSELRAEKVERDGQEFYLVEGYASAYERGYDMWDAFGPYTEVVTAGAGAKTLSANPFVVYRFNHTGTPMATTANKRLEIWEDSTGLGDRAWLNPTRSDVDTLITAIRDEDVTEQSFMFSIKRGVWSPDYSSFRIEEYDLDRGDVGPVTYGANPHTSVTSRSGEWLAMTEQVSPLARREAFRLLAERYASEFPNPHEIRSKTPAPDLEKLTQGRSVTLAMAELLSDADI